MAKKKKGLVLNNYYSFIALGIAVVCVCMLFLPSVSFFLGNKEVFSVNGWQAIFGHEVELNLIIVNISGKALEFSFMLLLPLILVAAGGIIPLALKNKFGAIISVACFIVAAVLAFMTTVLIMPTDIIKNLDSSLCIGPILFGAFSIVGACFGAIKILVK